MKKLLTRQAAAVMTLFLLLLCVSTSQVLAQNADEAPQAEAGRGDRDANWASALGLTPDQVTRIRAIRQENRFEWQAARQRVNQAQRALDQAIYSDDADEAVIEQRAREVAEAQAVEVRLRARTELSIRRVLTPEQLNTFRTLRQQRIRASQLRRRLEGRPLRNRQLGIGENQASPLDRNAGRPAGGGQRGRDADSLLGPRRRRGGLRRIRP
jgi:Spy/CpxP family protein refolding chaperone